MLTHNHNIANQYIRPSSQQQINLPNKNNILSQQQQPLLQQSKNINFQQTNHNLLPSLPQKSNINQSQQNNESIHLHQNNQNIRTAVKNTIPKQNNKGMIDMNDKENFQQSVTLYPISKSPLISKLNIDKQKNIIQDEQSNSNYKNREPFSIRTNNIEFSVKNIQSQDKNNNNNNNNKIDNQQMEQRPRRQSLDIHQISYSDKSKERKYYNDSYSNVLLQLKKTKEYNYTQQNQTNNTEENIPQNSSNKLSQYHFQQTFLNVKSLLKDSSNDITPKKYHTHNLSVEKKDNNNNNINDQSSIIINNNQSNRINQIGMLQNSVPLSLITQLKGDSDDIHIIQSQQKQNSVKNKHVKNIKNNNQNTQSASNTSLSSIEIIQSNTINKKQQQTQKCNQIVLLNEQQNLNLKNNENKEIIDSSGILIQNQNKINIQPISTKENNKINNLNQNQNQLIQVDIKKFNDALKIEDESNDDQNHLNNIGNTLQSQKKKLSPIFNINPISTNSHISNQSNHININQKLCSVFNNQEILNRIKTSSLQQQQQSQSCEYSQQSQSSFHESNSQQNQISQDSNEQKQFIKQASQQQQQINQMILNQTEQSDVENQNKSYDGIIIKQNINEISINKSTQRILNNKKKNLMNRLDYNSYTDEGNIETNEVVDYNDDEEEQDQDGTILLNLSLQENQIINNDKILINLDKIKGERVKNTEEPYILINSENESNNIKNQYHNNNNINKIVSVNLVQNPDYISSKHTQQNILKGKKFTLKQIVEKNQKLRKQTPVRVKRNEQQTVITSKQGLNSSNLEIYTQKNRFILPNNDNSTILTTDSYKNDVLLGQKMNLTTFEHHHNQIHNNNQHKQSIGIHSQMSNNSSTTIGNNQIQYLSVIQSDKICLTEECQQNYLHTKNNSNEIIQSFKTNDSICLNSSLPQDYQKQLTQDNEDKNNMQNYDKNKQILLIPSNLEKYTNQQNLSQLQTNNLIQNDLSCDIISSNQNILQQRCNLKTSNTNRQTGRRRSTISQITSRKQSQQSYDYIINQSNSELLKTKQSSNNHDNIIPSSLIDVQIHTQEDKPKQTPPHHQRKQSRKTVLSSLNCNELKLKIQQNQIEIDQHYSKYKQNNPHHQEGEDQKQQQQQQQQFECISDHSIDYTYMNQVLPSMKHQAKYIQLQTEQNQLNNILNRVNKNTPEQIQQKKRAISVNLYHIAYNHLDTFCSSKLPASSQCERRRPPILFQQLTQQTANNFHQNYNNHHINSNSNNNNHIQNICFQTHNNGFQNHNLDNLNNHNNKNNINTLKQKREYINLGLN